MRVFITGGTGFIGSSLVGAVLRKGHNVLLLSRNFKGQKDSNLKIVKGSLANISSWQKKLANFKPDAAIHAAWEGLPDHNAHLSKLNLEYGLNLTKLLSKIGCKRLIITGSGWEYGIQKSKLSENTPPKPFDAFTAAKHALHWLGREIAKENNMELIWTRLFYLYGPGQHHNSLIPYLIRCIKTGKVPEIRNPEAKNDFLYVEDLADALIKLLEKKVIGDTYNIGSGKLTSITTIANTVFKYFRVKGRFKKGKKIYKDKLSYFYADISRIKKDTGWEPKTNVKEGILKTIKLDY